jgi:3-oxoacyl-ACP reductase-like protein
VIRNFSSTPGTRWAAGIALAGAAISAAAMIGLGAAPAARADGASIADLLGQASTNFTAAEQVLAGVPTTDLPDLVLYQANLANTEFLDVTGLGYAENGILSYDNGEFATLVTPLFSDLDQNWLQASEAVLNANTAWVTAITDGTGLSAAEFGLIAPDLQAMGDQFVTGVIDQSAYLLSLF